MKLDPVRGYTRLPVNLVPEPRSGDPHPSPEIDEARSDALAGIGKGRSGPLHGPRLLPIRTHRGQSAVPRQKSCVGALSNVAQILAGAPYRYTGVPRGESSIRFIDSRRAHTLCDRQPTERGRALELEVITPSPSHRVGREPDELPRAMEDRGRRSQSRDFDGGAAEDTPSTHQESALSSGGRRTQ